MTNQLDSRNIIVMKRTNIKNDESGIIIFVIIVLVGMISLLTYRVMTAQNQADTDNNPDTSTIEEAQKTVDESNDASHRAGRALDAIR